MIHLVWSIFNVVIIFFFIYLIFGFIVEGMKIFETRFRIISISILILGIFQIISASNTKKQTNKIILKSNYNQTNNSKVKEVLLEDNLIFDINLHIKFSIDKNEFTPIESYSYLTGFTSGYVWEYKSIEINTCKPNRKTEFTAKGILKWHLFGINIYNESKVFRAYIE